MNWSVTATCIISHEPPMEEIENHLDLVMDELGKLGADPDMVATLAEGRVEIEVAAVGDDALEAMAQGLATIRTALHAAGAGTPNWPREADFVGAEQNEDGHWIVRFVEGGIRNPDLLTA
ncbi:MAG TPA: hypothetical protein VM142_12460 [Acidimicrobiales bacterium]|nr:hypothetical protein [Acidimicrobiales bacterium]